MVARSDIVIAVWDGLATRGVGGTADTAAAWREDSAGAASMACWSWVVRLS